MALYSPLPVHFISHGGGPWPWMLEQRQTIYAKLAASLVNIPALTGRRPTAILMISAHWEELNFTVQATRNPAMIYDYTGFPNYTYAITYPAPGYPPLAFRVAELLKQAGLQVDIDEQRGYDHGMYSPMEVMYPQADIPVVQLSLRHDFNPTLYIELGRTLKPLRDENILIICSGLSFHNMRYLTSFTADGSKPAAEFDRWLQHTILHQKGKERSNALIKWEAAPYARLAHPREEHLLPLHVAAGAGENDDAIMSFHEKTFMNGLSISNFSFGTPLNG